MKILFTGSRCHPHASQLKRFLDPLFDDNSEVIVGDNSDTTLSIDLVVRAYCEENNVPYTVHYADWDRYGRAAGPIRNKVMVDSKPDLVLAFPYGESRGTRHCIRVANEAGIPVIVVEVLDKQ